jgi:cytidine deaminase
MPPSSKSPDTSVELLRAAQRAAGRAYCPYSGFPVGAAVLAADGRIFDGCNVENASYGLAICAERVALFNAVAAGAGKIERLAVSCPNASPDQPANSMPCGACRQVMAEFLSADAEVVVDRVGTFRLAALLPDAFQLHRRH